MQGYIQRKCKKLYQPYTVYPLMNVWSETMVDLHSMIQVVCQWLIRPMATRDFEIYTGKDSSVSKNGQAYNAMHLCKHLKGEERTAR